VVENPFASLFQVALFCLGSQVRASGVGSLLEDPPLIPFVSVRLFPPSTLRLFSSSCSFPARILFSLLFVLPKDALDHPPCSSPPCLRQWSGPFGRILSMSRTELPLNRNLLPPGLTRNFFPEFDLFPNLVSLSFKTMGQLRSESSGLVELSMTN